MQNVVFLFSCKVDDILEKVDRVRKDSVKTDSILIMIISFCLNGTILVFDLIVNTSSYGAVFSLTSYTLIQCIFIGILIQFVTIVLGVRCRYQQLNAMFLGMYPALLTVNGMLLLARIKLTYIWSTFSRTRTNCVSPNKRSSFEPQKYCSELVIVSIFFAGNGK